MNIIKYRTELDTYQKNVLVKEKIIKYGSNDKNEEKLKFNSPDKIVEFLCRSFNMNRLAEEYMYMIALNTANYPIGVFEISHGSVNMSIASSREIYIRALLCGATSIVIAHNHPSERIHPSSDDINTTKQLFEAGKLLNVELLDSIIIGGTRDKSLKTDFPELFNIES